jgi:hypothetical protein
MTTTEPPLTDCPSWCEKPAGHDWEDQWTNGLIRYHSMRIHVETRSCSPTCIHGHEIGLDEVEQVRADGTTARLRQVVLDVESPTNLSPEEALHYAKAIVKATRISLRDMTIEHNQEVK